MSLDRTLFAPCYPPNTSLDNIRKSSALAKHSTNTLSSNAFVSLTTVPSTTFNWIVPYWIDHQTTTQSSGVFILLAAGLLVLTVFFSRLRSICHIRYSTVWGTTLLIFALVASQNITPSILNYKTFWFFQIHSFCYIPRYMLCLNNAMNLEMLKLLII